MSEELTREQVETTIARFLSWHDCEEQCDHDLKQVLATDAALRAKVEALEQELESHAWEISPAMAQAKIDGLNAKVAAMTWERDEAERREKVWELDYSRDLKAVIKERDRLKEALAKIKVWGSGLTQELAASALRGETGGG
jgi:Fe-S oxidoreductase